tara:strand:- start:910 stop:1776 length:867 start_codon:yes stop_codon:yes gene_type:complete
MTDKTDYLEVDNPIPGQNYTCISFISPENTLAKKELFMFNKYMSQRCAEFETKLGEIVEKSGDELRNQIKEDIVSQLHDHMKYSYEKFNSTFEDFKYKYNEQLEKQFNQFSDFKTSVRGVKVRGCFDTIQEAQNKAKELQRQDRSFHVFVGQVGYWLPWDPCADKVTDEEYLEEELNNMMKKYKENEVARDLLYEEEKRDKLKAAMQERLEAEKKQKELQENMEEPDPWLKSKFEDAPEVTSETTDPGVQAENPEGDSNTTETNVDSSTTAVPVVESTVESTNEVKEV